MQSAALRWIAMLGAARLARLVGGSFRLSPVDDAMFASVSTDALEYAAAISADGRALSFTRVEGKLPFTRIGIWIAHREREIDAFGAPVRIAAIDGFAEAVTFSPDGRALHYHKRVGSRFSLLRTALERAL